MNGCVYNNMAERLRRDPLPPQWSFGVKSDGRIFFINEDTRSTTWLHPLTGKAVATGYHERSDLPQGWQEGITREGAVYFMNHNTGKTTFNHPISQLPEAEDDFLLLDRTQDTPPYHRPALAPLQMPPDNSHPAPAGSSSYAPPLSPASNPTTPSAPTTPGGPSGPTSPTTPTSSERPSFRKKNVSKSSSLSLKRRRDAVASMEGWLYKQDNSALKVWRKRWCVLADFCLFYYKGSDKTRSESGSILIPSYRIAAVSPQDKITKRFAFKCEHENMRTYYFAAENQVDMNQWMRALNLAANVQLDRRQQSQQYDDEEAGFGDYHAQSPKGTGNSRDDDDWLFRSPKELNELNGNLPDDDYAGPANGFDPDGHLPREPDESDDARHDKGGDDAGDDDAPEGYWDARERYVRNHGRYPEDERVGRDAAHATPPPAIYDYPPDEDIDGYSSPDDRKPEGPDRYRDEDPRSSPSGQVVPDKETSDREEYGMDGAHRRGRTQDDYADRKRFRSDEDGQRDGYDSSNSRGFSVRPRPPSDTDPGEDYTRLRVQPHPQSDTDPGEDYTQLRSQPHSEPPTHQDDRQRYNSLSESDQDRQIVPVEERLVSSAAPTEEGGHEPQSDDRNGHHRQPSRPVVAEDDRGKRRPRDSESSQTSQDKHSGSSRTNGDQRRSWDQESGSASSRDNGRQRSRSTGKGRRGGPVPHSPGQYPESYNTLPRPRSKSRERRDADEGQVFYDNRDQPQDGSLDRRQHPQYDSSTSGSLPSPSVDPTSHPLRGGGRRPPHDDPRRGQSSDPRLSPSVERSASQTSRDRGEGRRLDPWDAQGTRSLDRSQRPPRQAAESPRDPHQRATLPHDRRGPDARRNYVEHRPGEPDHPASDVSKMSTPSGSAPGSVDGRASLPRGPRGGTPKQDEERRREQEAGSLRRGDPRGDPRRSDPRGDPRRDRRSDPRVDPRRRDPRDDPRRDTRGDPRSDPRRSDPGVEDTRRDDPQRHDPRGDPRRGDPRGDPRADPGRGDFRGDPRDDPRREDPQRRDPRGDPKGGDPRGDPRADPGRGDFRGDPRDDPRRGDPRAGPSRGDPRGDPRRDPRRSDPRGDPRRGDPRADPRDDRRRSDPQRGGPREDGRREMEAQQGRRPPDSLHFKFPKNGEIQPSDISQEQRSFLQSPLAQPSHEPLTPEQRVDINSPMVYPKGDPEWPTSKPEAYHRARKREGQDESDRDTPMQGSMPRPAQPDFVPQPVEATIQRSTPTNMTYAQPPPSHNRHPEEQQVSNYDRPKKFGSPITEEGGDETDIAPRRPRNGGLNRRSDRNTLERNELNSGDMLAPLTDGPGTRGPREPTSRFKKWQMKAQPYILLSTGIRLRLSIAAGDLLGKSHEELVLLLIQLRRDQSNLQRWLDMIDQELAMLTDPTTPPGSPSRIRARHSDSLLRRSNPNLTEEREFFEELELEREEVERELEISRPLVHLVDNLVRMGSLYGGENQMIAQEFYRDKVQKDLNYIQPKKLIEFSRRLEEEKLNRDLRGELRQIQTAEDRLLEEKLKQLHVLDRRLQEISAHVTLLKEDKDKIEASLDRLGRQMDAHWDQPDLLAGMEDQQRRLERDQGKVRTQLALGTKELEEIAAENGKIEYEVTILRSKLDGRHSRSVKSPEVGNTKARLQMENEVTRVQSLLTSLDKKRDQLVNQMQTLRTGPAEVQSEKISRRRRDHSPRTPKQYTVTDLDTMVSHDINASPATVATANDSASKPAPPLRRRGDSIKKVRKIKEQQVQQSPVVESVASSTAHTSYHASPQILHPQPRYQQPPPGQVDQSRPPDNQYYSSPSTSRQRGDIPSQERVRNEPTQSGWHGDGRPDKRHTIGSHGKRSKGPRLDTKYHTISRTGEIIPGSPMRRTRSVPDRKGLTVDEDQRNTAVDRLLPGSPYKNTSYDPYHGAVSDTEASPAAQSAKKKSLRALGRSQGVRDDIDIHDLQKALMDSGDEGELVIPEPSGPRPSDVVRGDYRPIEVDETTGGGFCPALPLSQPPLSYYQAKRKLLREWFFASGDSAQPQLGMPAKIVIPERYLPGEDEEEERTLSPEERERHEERVDRITKMLSAHSLSEHGATLEYDSQSLQEWSPSEILCSWDQAAGFPEPGELRQKVEEEKQARQEVLTMRRALAQQVKEQSKVMAARSMRITVGAE